PLVEASAELTAYHGQSGNPAALGQTTTIAWIVEGRARPERWLELHLAVPGVYLANEAGATVAAHQELDLGSPYLGAAVVGWLERVRVRCELGVGLPLGSNTTGTLESLGRDVANWLALVNAYGGRDFWLWGRQRTAFVGSLDAQHRDPRGWLLEGRA